MDARHAPTADEPRQRNWHLHWQAAHGQSFLPVAGMADRIRERLIAAHQKRSRVLIDYTILPTEIHLISGVRGGDTPGDLAGAIGNFVSRWVREVQSFRSHVMGGPFHQCILRSDDDVRHEIRMFAWRPVVLGLCRGPTFHAHSALRVALGWRHHEGFDARPMLGYFGPVTTKAREALSTWISERPSKFESLSWELARGLALAPCRGAPQASGFKEVKTQEAAALLAKAGEGGVEAALGLLVKWVSKKIDAPAGLDLMKDRNGHAARGRAIVARIAAEHRLCSSAFVAGYFQRGKSTLCEQVAASRLRQADNAVVATPVDSIIGEPAVKKVIRDYGAKDVGGRRAGR